MNFSSKKQAPIGGAPYKSVKEGVGTLSNVASFNLVSCPARMRLLARNGMVNKVEFLACAYYRNVVMTNEVARSVIIT